ncbi:Methylase of polypeptide chain release factors [Nocardioides scoriae]|uniref:Methylase of polypeptide chain release factors n=1 Tax=Nocardioides scoriae TaxID=642780 RepID=A0A1H1LX76_9ACTN|nr:class I SAM-dependent methyltransferase [Nocardioides scoriae]SDR78997.1 Methylase of polypeptide chain release factors [Nocardioides scoriae]
MSTTEQAPGTTPEQVPGGVEVEVAEFGELEIAFDARVLRPRHWTTAQSRWAHALLPSAPEGPVLELCSGAGHIGLLAVHGSERSLVCVDASPVAAAYTRSNAERAGMGGRVEVRHGMVRDVLAPGERFALVIADPPWVPAAETARFPEDPLLAIDGGPDGMVVVDECLRALVAHLAPGGAAVLQLGTAFQADAVAQRLRGTDLVVGELREYGEHGVLVRLDRSA